MALNAVYTYPENAQVREIERQRSRVIDANQIGSELLPMDTQDTDNVLWEVRDDVRGLTFSRSANAPFPLRTDTGANRFAIIPGMFGEMIRLDEKRITSSRRIGTFGEAIDVSAECSRLMEDLAIREAATIQYIRWSLLTSGVVNVPDQSGRAVEVGRMTLATFTPSTAWTTSATATPLADLRSLRDNNVGFFDFGGNARLYGNSKTSSTLWANTNQNDIAGKRTLGLGQVLGLEAYNAVIAPQESLPVLIAYDGTYLDATGTPVKFIPDGKLVLVGNHWSYGNRIGEYVVTRNANNPNGEPGVYAEIGLSTEPPRLPWVARGHNGGPRVNYTKQVILVNAF